MSSKKSNSVLAAEAIMRIRNESYPSNDRNQFENFGPRQMGRDAVEAMKRYKLIGDYDLVSCRASEPGEPLGSVMELRCTNDECPTRKYGDNAVFSTNLTVDPSGELDTDVHSVRGSDFVCCVCESPAEWVDKKGQE